MESYIPISFLNDFIFCPRSIYFSQLYRRRDQFIYKEKSQIEGSESHKSIDFQTYSTKKDILQGISVYSEKYRLCGKIDIFDKKEGVLIERKKLIKTIYDGYIFQIYAQYFCLSEMGYFIKRLFFYSMDTNKRYSVSLPSDDKSMKDNFEKLIQDINYFNLNMPFRANPNKCEKCIYINLCDRGCEI